MWYEEETYRYDAHSGADHFRACSCTDDRPGRHYDGRHSRCRSDRRAEEYDPEVFQCFRAGIYNNHSHQRR